jgi:hypothetical protein
MSEDFPPRVEPSAQMLYIANFYRQWYLSMLAVGFTQDEAMQLLSLVIQQHVTNTIPG